jgi:hypothetical protein
MPDVHDFIGEPAGIDHQNYVLGIDNSCIRLKKGALKNGNIRVAKDYFIHSRSLVDCLQWVALRCSLPGIDYFCGFLSADAVRMFKKGLADRELGY